MDAIQQARKLFLKCHQHQAFLKDSDKQQLGRDIQRFIGIAIKEATSRDLFTNPLMLDILRSALKQRARENLDVMPVARAFQSLEKYFLLLVEQPWKQEFREIKMYGGFYRTRVKSVLPDCEAVFEHAGYMVLPDTCTMIHRGQPNKNFLLLLAFDCRVGQVECETIAEHYSKVKGLSMSLEEAICNILRDENTRNKVTGKFGYPQENGLIVNMPLNSNMAPPALPKREPVGNGSNTRHNMGYEIENQGFNNLSNMFDNTGLACPPRSPSRTCDLYSLVVSRPPMTPAGVNPNKFTYMDTSRNEILPDLPQGTSEDHMLESLRHLNMKEVSRHQGADSWKQYAGLGSDGRIVTGPNQLSHTAPVTSSVNGLKAGIILAQSSWKPAHSIDEGIEQDLSTCKFYPHSAKYTSSIGGHQVMANKSSGNPQQVSLDQGYRTVTGESIYSPSTGSFLHNIPAQTIYHPPSISTDCPGAPPAKSFVPRHSAPPPIPSRALKPKSVKEDDVSLQSKMFTSVPQYFSQPIGMSHVQSEVIVSRPPMSAPGYSTLPRHYTAEPVLRKERLALGKTNSLTTGELRSNTLAQQAASSGRIVHSMDMTLTSWKCPSCGTLNAVSDIVCFLCSYNQFGPEVGSPAVEEAQVSCSSCTFVNKPGKTYCEMCGSKLGERFTLV